VSRHSVRRAALASVRTFATPSRAIAAGAGDVLVWIEVAVDVENVADLPQLVRRQVLQLSDVVIGRIPLGYADQLAFPARAPWSARRRPRPGHGPGHRVRRLDREHQRIQRLAVAAGSLGGRSPSRPGPRTPCSRRSKRTSLVSATWYLLRLPREVSPTTSTWSVMRLSYPNQTGAPLALPRGGQRDSPARWWRRPRRSLRLST
jgi:hypothetical protein